MWWILALTLAACGGDEDKEEDTDPGDDTPTPEVVDEDGDGSPAEQDCDDADPHLFPGAPELCDQRANDCDTMGSGSEADEAGTAMFTNADGLMSDFTTWPTGSEDAPVSVTLSQTGQIDLCEGTCYVSLDVSADLDLNAHGDVALSGGGQATIVAVLAEDITVKISDLRLQDGLASVGSSTDEDLEGPSGGALHMDVASTVDLASVVLSGNNGENGGAIFVGAGAEVSLVNSTVEDNSSELWAGGGTLGAAGAAISLDNIDFSGNDAGGVPAGLAYGLSDTLTLGLGYSGSWATAGPAKTVRAASQPTRTETTGGPDPGWRPRPTKSIRPIRLQRRGP